MAKNKFHILPIILLLAAAYLPGLLKAAEATERTARDVDVQIEIADGRISLDVRDIELKQVLKEISQKSAIHISFDDQVEGKVTLKLVDTPIEEALKQLCESRAVVYEYNPESKTYRIVSVGAFTSKKEKGKESAEGEAFKSSKPAQKQSAQLSRAEGQSREQGKTRSTLLPERKYDARGRLIYKPGELLVKFKSNASQIQISNLHATLGSQVIGRMPKLRLEKLKLAEGLSEKEAIDLYSGSGLVEIVEKHVLRYPNKTPNDPLFADQWGLTNIRAPQAWDITQGCPEVVIAVIDTGVDHLHPDLSDNIWRNTAELNGLPGIDDDTNNYEDDFYGWDFAGDSGLEANLGDNDPMDVDVEGHGTHVAGIIAGAGNNSQGIAGICWNAKIMALKVQSDNGTSFEDWDVIEAIQYAIANGAQIVNCSFGGSDFLEIEYNAFVGLRDAGVLAVCAAGNDGLNTDDAGNENYPAGYDLDNIVSVAASTQIDTLASLSNYGLLSVDLMAPGIAIKSTVPAAGYTDASVSYQDDSSTIELPAIGMAHAGTTDENGITALAYDCGQGYLDEVPDSVNGYIALIKRGNRDGVDFFFSQKTENAQSKGAIAVIIYNDVVDDFDQNGGTLVTPGDWVPVVSITNADGLALISLIPNSGEPIPFPLTLINKPLDETSSYTSISGTSMAAPHVSGVAGLVLSLDSSLSYTAVKSTLMDSVDKIFSVTDKLVSGGRLNAFNAVCEICSSNAEPGDLSCNGTVGIDDAILSLRILAGFDQAICSALLSKGIDVDGNGLIGLEEMIHIMQVVSELRTP
ncbi:S8 family serine peptidase [Thermodesulfobacteriota bacterium]